jgi:hypothetical protein
LNYINLSGRSFATRGVSEFLLRVGRVLAELVFYLFDFVEDVLLLFGSLHFRSGIIDWDPG